jgi:hypothetical protein
MGRLTLSKQFEYPRRQQQADHRSLVCCGAIRGLITFAFGAVTAHFGGGFGTLRRKPVHREYLRWHSSGITHSLTRQKESPC